MSAQKKQKTEEQSKVWYAPNKFQAYGEEEIQAVTDCLRDGWLAPGPRTDKFEKEVSAFFGKQHGVFVNSGSSANIIGLAVLGLAKGSEIITPALSFATCVAPIMQLGFTPVFVDSKKGHYVPTVEDCVAAVTPKTKVMMIPNLVGQKLDWAEMRKQLAAINRSDIVLFEDSCDTMTHTVESDMAVISFYASHVITAGGCGGMVMFNDIALKRRALMFRDWGRVGNNTEDMSERMAYTIDGIEFDFKFLYEVLGYNMKCCEMNAAFGLVQMTKLKKFQAIRAAFVDRYVQNLKGTSYTLPPEHNDHDWLAMPLGHKKRSGIVRYLEDNNVQVRMTFSGNITRHKPFRQYYAVWPNADTIMAEGFLVGAHHGLTNEDVDRVCDLLIKFDKGEADKKYYEEPKGQLDVFKAGYKQDGGSTEFDESKDACDF